MSRSSDRGQTEPIAALVALLAVGAGLSVYAGVIPSAEVLGTTGPHDATDALERVHDETASDGVARPESLAVPNAVETDAAAVRAVLWTADDRWAAGATPRSDERRPDDRAERSLAVRTGPGTNEPGTLRVEVWE